jgi:hypothetical protein
MADAETADLQVGGKSPLHGQNHGRLRLPCPRCHCLTEAYPPRPRPSRSCSARGIGRVRRRWSATAVRVLPQGNRDAIYARAVSRRGRRNARPHCGPDRSAFPRAVFVAVGAIGKHKGLCRHGRHPLGAGARNPDHGGDGVADRFLFELARIFCPQGHAAGHHP